MAIEQRLRNPHFGDSLLVERRWQGNRQVRRVSDPRDDARHACRTSGERGNRDP